ncbi:MAG TPA: TraR/DksA family transcriptional regulator [Nitrospira sp.]|nr:TraR/DksA family transcriptional regulator [Nitrospira sp.]
MTRDQSTTDKRKAALRHMLIEQRQAIQRDIDESLAGYRSGQARMREESVPDAEDLSLRNSTGDERLSLLESRSRTRDQLDEALRRLEEGRYGICEECGAQIGEARLRAVPFARRCIACQEKAEVLEKIERKEDREEI